MNSNKKGSEKSEPYNVPESNPDSYQEELPSAAADMHPMLDKNKKALNYQNLFVVPIQGKL